MRQVKSALTWLWDKVLRFLGLRASICAHCVHCLMSPYPFTDIDERLDNARCRMAVETVTNFQTGKTLKKYGSPSYCSIINPSGRCLGYKEVQTAAKAADDLKKFVKRGKR